MIVNEHTGIVVCTFDPDVAALAQRIHTALGAQPQMAGQPRGGAVTRAGRVERGQGIREAA